jgi:hypothetical protein
MKIDKRPVEPSKSINRPKTNSTQGRDFFSKITLF